MFEFVALIICIFGFPSDPSNALWKNLAWTFVSAQSWKKTLFKGCGRTASVSISAKTGRSVKPTGSRLYGEGGYMVPNDDRNNGN